MVNLPLLIFIPLYAIRHQKFGVDHYAATYRRHRIVFERLNAAFEFFDFNAVSYECVESFYGVITTGNELTYAHMINFYSERHIVAQEIFFVFSHKSLK